MAVEQQFPGLFPGEEQLGELGWLGQGSIEPSPPAPQPSPEIKQLVADFQYAHEALQPICSLSTGDAVMVLLQLVLSEARLIARSPEEEPDEPDAAFQSKMEL